MIFNTTFDVSCLYFLQIRLTMEPIITLVVVVLVVVGFGGGVGY